MGQIIRLGAFLIVPLIGTWIMFSIGRRRRLAVWTLFGYIVVMHAVVLVRQKEAWPFASYQGLHGRGRLDALLWRIDFVGIDSSGKEWVIDPEAWDAVHQVPLQLWAYNYLVRLDPAERARVMKFLYDTAEKGRQRLAAGKRTGAERWLGPLAMPYWYRLERHRAVPAEPYAGLRIYQVGWRAGERVEDPRAESRVRLASYRR